METHEFIDAHFEIIYDELAKIELAISSHCEMSNTDIRCKNEDKRYFTTFRDLRDQHMDTVKTQAQLVADYNEITVRIEQLLDNLKYTSETEDLLMAKLRDK